MNMQLRKYIFYTLGLVMSAFSHLASGSEGLQSVDNKFIQVGDVNFSYRTFGPKTGIPLVLLQHFTGTMDYWDPALVDGLAETRPVIVFNNRGVGSSDGKVADNIEHMAKDARTFIVSLGYDKVDLLGFSMGGFIAQELAANHPELVNKLILAGTTYQGGGESLMKVLNEAFSMPELADPRLHLFFSPSQKGQKAGNEFLLRVNGRKENRDPESGEEIVNAHAKALITWVNTKDMEHKLLRKIHQPVLVVSGSNDTMLNTQSSISMYQILENAQLILYPDSNHGAIFEYNKSFVNAANDFLSD